VDVAVFRARAMEKMGAQTLADLIHFADKAGIGAAGPMQRLH
jgi:FixJ family two-component response regulator